MISDKDTENVSIQNLNYDVITLMVSMCMHRYAHATRVNMSINSNKCEHAGLTSVYRQINQTIYRGKQPFSSSNDSGKQHKTSSRQLSSSCEAKRDAAKQRQAINNKTE